MATINLTPDEAEAVVKAIETEVGYLDKSIRQTQAVPSSDPALDAELVATYRNRIDTLMSVSNRLTGAKK